MPAASGILRSVEIALKILLAYLLGSLSGSLLLGRLRGVDIRTVGSGNAGGTNALRTQGWRFALGVVLIDIGKGALAVGLLPAWAWGLGETPRPLLDFGCLLAAVLGHIYPVFHGFRGGKGAATAIGGLAVLSAPLLIVLLCVWLLCVLISGYVGLATMLAALSLPIASVWLAPEPRIDWVLFGATLAALIIYAHRANIVRLRSGTESRFERLRVLRWPR